MHNQTIFSILLLIILKSAYSSLQKSYKKLDFLFKRDDFFCPVNHKKTLIEDLCYLVSNKKKASYQEAEEHCNKTSQRLAQIDDLHIWQNIKFGLNKMFDSRSDLNLSFYIASNLKAKTSSLINDNSAINYQFYSDNKFFCSKTNFSTKNSCLELKYLYFNWNRSSIVCLNSISCKRHRYALCEWRGDKLENYNVYLKNQILKAFISIMFAIFLFFSLWTLFYLYHKHSVKNELTNAYNSYLKENEIFLVNK